MKYLNHKYAELFPLITGIEFENLKKDIKENGLFNPIVLFEGKILDGRNRNNACTELGIEPIYETYEGNDPIGYVISLNVKRRHLNASQLAVIALEILPFYELDAKKRSGERTDLRQKIDSGSFGKATEKVGKVLGVNRQYISDAKLIRENAPEELEQIKNLLGGTG